MFFPKARVAQPPVEPIEKSTEGAEIHCLIVTSHSHMDPLPFEARQLETSNM